MKAFSFCSVNTPYVLEISIQSADDQEIDSYKREDAVVRRHSGPGAQQSEIVGIAFSLNFPAPMDYYFRCGINGKRVASVEFDADIAVPSDDVPT